MYFKIFLKTLCSGSRSYYAPLLNLSANKKTKSLCVTIFDIICFLFVCTKWPTIEYCFRIQWVTCVVSQSMTHSNLISLTRLWRSRWKNYIFIPEKFNELLGSVIENALKKENVVKLYTYHASFECVFCSCHRLTSFYLV